MKKKSLEMHMTLCLLKRKRRKRVIHLNITFHYNNCVDRITQNLKICSLKWTKSMIWRKQHYLLKAGNDNRLEVICNTSGLSLCEYLLVEMNKKRRPYLKKWISDYLSTSLDLQEQGLINLFLKNVCFLFRSIKQGFGELNFC